MIVLDTHAWVWWVSDPAQLSRRARQRIDDEAGRGRICVSSISVWEVAILASKKRLRFSIPAPEWIARTERIPELVFVPVDNGVALRSADLPGFSHPDPADRMIVATALELRAPLVSKDRRIRDYPAVETLW